MDALIALGYSVVNPRLAVQSLPKDAPELLENGYGWARFSISRVNFFLYAKIQKL